MTNDNLSKLLLQWYDKNGRDLPWRVKGSAHPNPYVVLVSEFMLQQTTVKTVIPYFHRFMARFPTVESLAKATDEEIYLHWQGLGYYSRARALHSTAKKIMEQFDGVFPQEFNDVIKLKGVGEYTAASFLALGFNKPLTVVDGNVIRIICRLEKWVQPVEDIMDNIRKRAHELTDINHAADYASAIMDLGAMICTPKNPQCLLCPWQNCCRSKGFLELEKIPLRRKINKKEVKGVVYIIRNQQGDIFIRKRTEPGLLSGLYEFPWNEEEVYNGAVATGLTVTHIFTHIHMELKILTLCLPCCPSDGIFVRAADIKNFPMSTLMQKVFRKIAGFAK